MSLSAGTILGPYTIIAPIGAGGMGEVYRARDARIGRDVAIKVLPDSISQDPERLKRFEQEAKSAGMLNHPNLLTIFDVGGSGDAPYMVSELLEGETLRDRLDKGAIPYRKVVDYGLQIAHGLAAAHEKGLVHRDLKPENVFITEEGRVKILDFGLAKLSPQMAPQNPGMTEPGMVLGTVGYMSPEQVRGEPLDQRSDIFSFGAILYEMLAGGRAFRRDSSIETLSAILREEPVDLVEINANVSPALERVVRRCLEKSKQQRFQSARDLAFHLESLPTVTSGQSQPSPPPAPVPFSRGETPPSIGGSRDAATALLKTPPGQPSLRQPAMRNPSMATPASSVTSAAPRPVPQKTSATQRTVIPQKPVRKTSSPALALVAAVLFTIAGLAGGYFASNYFQHSSVATYQRLTFRRGEIYAARFAPDGDTIVYTASWENHPAELFLMRRQSPESRPFGLVGADIASISKNGDMALLLKKERLSGQGTLAQAPLVGGTPRQLMENVLFADWGPDGQSLAVVHQVGRNYRIEYPIGKVLYETGHPLQGLRVSRDGRIAFIELDRGEFNIVMIEKGDMELLARGWSHGINGLAWSPNGKEVWFTGSDSGSSPLSLFAVSPGGKPRLMSRMAGSLRLQDLTPDGRLLVTHNSWRSALMCLTPGDTAERDLSWFDWSIATDISRDGKTILFSETREGGGEKNSVYLRSIDGSAAVRLGDGYSDSLSPDGKWALCHRGRTKLVLLPTGTGEARELASLDSVEQGAMFFPDGHNILLAGARKSQDYALYVENIDSGAIRPISPEGIWSSGSRQYAISPDGRLVAGMNKERRIVLYHFDGSAATVIQGVQEEEVPISFNADGTSLYVYKASEVPAKAYKVDLATGGRELWKEFAPLDPAGVYRISPILMTPDASTYVYNSLRSLSDLYTVEGLK